MHIFQEETVEEFGENGIDPLTVSLYQMNLDRTQFLLRSYLQIRLQKVTLNSAAFLGCVWTYVNKCSITFKNKRFPFSMKSSKKSNSFSTDWALYKEKEFQLIEFLFFVYKF